MLQRVVFGKITKPENAELPDLNAREIGLIIPLMVLMLFMGVYPRPFLDRSKAAIEEIRARVAAPTAGTFAEFNAARDGSTKSEIAQKP
jgi:NADH-quinone oxidoreductase subunit M